MIVLVLYLGVLLFLSGCIAGGVVAQLFCETNKDTFRLNLLQANIFKGYDVFSELASKGRGDVRAAIDKGFHVNKQENDRLLAELPFDL